MEAGKFEQIIHLISKRDTTSAEELFNKPGGRKYLENIVLIIVSGLQYPQEEKADLFRAFVKGLDNIERRIKHQKEGQKIIEKVFF
jgi:hypothetical protein